MDEKGLLCTPHSQVAGAGPALFTGCGSALIQVCPHLLPVLTCEVTARAEACVNSIL